MESNSFQGFGNNIYGNNITNQVNSYETNGMQHNQMSAMSGPQTGVIPNMGFQQNILNNTNGNNGVMGGANSLSGAGGAFRNGGGTLGVGSAGNFVSPLSGESIAVENFTHNNMVPFFGGSVKQNMNIDNNRNTLGKYTGTDEFYRKKQEVKSFYDVTKISGGNMNGAPPVSQEQRFMSHYLPSTKISNELPIEQNRVAPISNREFDKIKRSAGISKTVDELRSISKPKASGLEGRMKPGALPSGSRGMVGKTNKNKPETYYRKTPDMYFKTGGSIKASKLREKVYAKPTNRMRTRSYYGVAGQSENVKSYKRSAVQKTRRNNYMNSTPRNAHDKDAWNVMDNCEETGVGDYGKGAIENKPNERDITQVRTVINNITTEVKKLIAPIQDVIRMTRKENFVGNIRPEGNMKADMPSKLKVHDSEDIARTTIKETNIHNNHEGFLSGGEFKLKAHDPEDIARTTIKEQNIHNEKGGSLNMTPQQPTSLRVHDPEDVPRTTLKETTIENKYTGGASASNEYNKGGYLSNRVNMSNTNRQFTSDHEYYGGANGDNETGGGRGYLVTRVHAKNTNKQFLSNNEYKGTAGFYNKAPISYADKYRMRLNPNKEHISRGRAPTEQGAKVSLGGDKINMQFKKLEGDQINVRDPNETHVYVAPPSKNSCGLTTIKNKLPESVQRDRISEDILSAYKDNPYTQSLHSSA